MPKGQEGPPRKRAQHKNSHSGCGTCKQRHVKCDETKPICLRCQRAGRECITDVVPIYRPRSFRGFKLVTPSGPPSLAHTRTNSSSAPSSDSSPGVISEQLYFSYFVERSLPVLCTFEPSPLWMSVERLIQDEGHPIRQIAKAVGCQHMSMSSRDETLEADAQRIYADALGVLRSAMENASVSTLTEVLVASLLLAVLQSLRGYPIESIVHLHGGINIAKEQLECMHHPEVKECLRFLEKLALKITIAESRSEAGRMGIRLVYALWISVPEDLYSIDKIKTEADALIVEHEIQRGLLSMIFALFKDRKRAEELPTDLLPDGSAVVELLRFKHAKLEAYLAAQLAAINPDKDLSKWAKYSFALARSLLLKIFLKCAWDGTQTAYDTCHDEYIRILGLIEDVLLRSDRSCILQEISVIAFCFGLGPLVTLTMVANGCRNHTTRRRALALFDRGPPCEGTMNVQYLRRLCQARISFEDRKAAEVGGVADVDFGIPDSCRIHYHILDTSEDAEHGPAATMCAYRKAASDDEHFTIEVLEY